LESTTLVATALLWLARTAATTYLRTLLLRTTTVTAAVTVTRPG
jgi:hypothetical protein